MRDASRHPPRSHFRCLNQHCAWKSSHTDCDLMALRVNTSCSHCSMRGAIMNLWNDDMSRTYFIRRSSLWMIILHHSLILIDTETVTFPWLPLMLPPTLFLHLYPQVCVCVWQGRSSWFSSRSTPLLVLLVSCLPHLPLSGHRPPVYLMTRSVLESLPDYTV